MTRDTEVQRAFRDITTRPSPGFWDALDGRLANEAVPARAPATKPSRIRNLRFVAPSLVAVAAAATAIVMVSTSGPSPVREFEPMLASQVISAAEDAYQSATGIRGSYRLTVNPSSTFADIYTGDTTGELRLRADGDFYQSAVMPGEGSGVTTYDAATGERTNCLDEGAGFSCTVIPGLADVWLLGTNNYARAGEIDNTGLALRALASTPDAALTEEQYEGRSVWRVSAPLVVGQFAGSDRADLLVDKASNFPVQVTYKTGGRVDFTFSLTDFELNPTFTDADFTTAGLGSVRTDTAAGFGYERLSIDEADQRGYRVFEPTEIPDGFNLAEVSVIDPTADLTVEERERLQYPRASNMVLTYRRGLESFTVQTAGATASAAEDFGDLNGDSTSEDSADAQSFFGLTPQRLTKEEVALTGGAYAGTTAAVRVGETSTFLFGHGTDNAWAIAGTITKETGLQIANSLRER